VDSLATEVFWSRCPIAIGDCAVKYLLQPERLAGTPSVSVPGDDYLRKELIERLKRGPVTYSLATQRFVDERATPIEDMVTSWDDAGAPTQTLGELIIAQQDLSGTAGEEAGQAAEELDYNPWNCVANIRPIGRMSRARLHVYEASVAYRKQAAYSAGAS
jgi:hypothetical protein